MLCHIHTQCCCCRGPSSYQWQMPRCTPCTCSCAKAWAPSFTKALFFLPLQGSVKSLAADATGHHLVTTGTDSQVCVWDLRTFKPLHSYFSRAPAEWCDISQRGMLAVGWGRKLSVWRDALARKQAAPYLSHNLLGEPSGISISAHTRWDQVAASWAALCGNTACWTLQ